MILRFYKADLHIHTCLSPCADLTMSPKRVIERAIEEKLDIIGICDHNSAENILAAKKLSSDEITVLAGMEITSIDEVHILSLFDDTDSILDLQKDVYKYLTPGENEQNVFGEQIVVNEYDEVEGYNTRLLLGATSLTLEDLVNKIHLLGGIAIASHVDRENYGIINQLGFIPEDIEFDALEISYRITEEEAVRKFPQISHYPLITSSDAHYLDDIGRKTTSFFIEEPSVSELKKAFNKKEGRSIRI